MELDESLPVAGRQNYNRKASPPPVEEEEHGFSGSEARLPELIPPALRPFENPLESYTPTSPATYNTILMNYHCTTVHMAPGYQVLVMNPGLEPNSNPMEFPAVQSSTQNDQNQTISNTGSPITAAGLGERSHDSESELLGGSGGSTFNKPPVAPVAPMYSDFQNQMLQLLGKSTTHLPGAGQGIEPAPTLAKPAIALAAADHGFAPSHRPAFLLATTIVDRDPAAMEIYFYQQHNTMPSLNTFVTKLREQHQLTNAHYARALEVKYGQKCINIDDIGGKGLWCWEATMTMVEESGGFAVVRVTVALN